MTSAKLIVGDRQVDLPIVRGSEGELAIDIATLRASTGLVTFDPGLGNTASCKSEVTFTNGEEGLLRYRGYPIEQVAKRGRFTEVCYTIINGNQPSAEELAEFRNAMTRHTLIHEDMKKFYEGYPPHAHPMAIMAAMFASLSSFYEETEETIDLNIIRILAKSKTLAAFSYKKSIGQPFVYPRNDLSWAGNFLHMMFAVPSEDYEVNEVLESALNLLLVLHADHEQNCSTSVLRAVGSAQTNLFASISAAICALWGPLHGGANQSVIEMLDALHGQGSRPEQFLAQVKDGKNNVRLMGFGHRVYKNFDPRAKLLKDASDRIFSELQINDPLLASAKELEEAALADDYFIERKLYPNVDFYSGLIYRALGIPKDMFTVMFALGRLPGWIAHWREQRDDARSRIQRPRQVYVGATEREFEDRGSLRIR